MRKLAFTAAAAATLFGAITAGTAADFQHQVNLFAVAPVVCSIGTAPTSTGNFSEIVEGSSTLTVLFTDSSDVAPQTASLNFGQGFCTGPSTTISLERTFLEVHEPAAAAAAAAAGFRTRIDYTAAVNWGGGANILSLAANQENNQTEVGGKTGAFVLNINIPGNVGPFAADEYADALVLTVGPTA